MSDNKIEENIFGIPAISAVFYWGVSAHMEPSSSYLMSYIWGLFYLYVLVSGSWNRSEEGEHRPIPVKMAFGFTILYTLYFIVFSHNIYILSFHHVLYAIIIIILQEILMRNITNDTRIEATRESMKNNTGLTIGLLIFLTIFLFFSIYFTYFFQLDFTGSFIDFLMTLPMVVWMIMFFCVVVYNYLMYRRLVPLVEYVEGSDDQI